MDFVSTFVKSYKTIKKTNSVSSWYTFYTALLCNIRIFFTKINNQITRFITDIIFFEVILHSEKIITNPQKINFDHHKTAYDPHKMIYC